MPFGFQIFSSRNETSWDLCIYPVPKSIIPELPSITEMVEEQSAILNTKEDNIQSETLLKPPKSPSAAVQKTMKISELLAVLLIFCLIFLALSVMWENLGTTVILGGVCFPILRYFGKI